MDIYENEIPESDRDVQVPSDRSEDVTHKKPSPFADSPYEMYHDTTYHYANKETVKPPKAKRTSGGAWKKIIAAVLVVALVGGSCGITAGVLNNMWEERMERLTLAMNQKIDALKKENADHQGSSDIPGGANVPVGNTMTPSQVYQTCINSVVAITTYVKSTQGNSYTGYSSGSGVIMSEDGYVVSNSHVVSGADRLVVTTHDGQEYEAKLIGSDAANDVALLKIEASGLQAAVVGSSDDLAVGDQVVAIGNPLGELTATQTVGYISGKDRAVTTDGTVINMLQTDAAINSGNSGGPLFDMYGRVVGITTAKYSGTTGSGASIEGIGFAIPIDDVFDILDDLKTYGYVTGGYLGVTVSDTDAAAASMFNLPVGAYIHEVTPGSCAEKGGILPKDIILDFGGYEIGGLNDLTRALRKFKAGDKVIVTIFRSGAEKQLMLILDEKPRPTEQSDVQPTQPSTPTDDSAKNWFDFLPPFFGFDNED